MVKWEYIKFTSKDPMEHLNKLGQQGWELVSTTTVWYEGGLAPYHNFFLKRQAEEPFIPHPFENLERLPNATYDN